MSQIKPTQILPGRGNRVNPVSSLPIDLEPSQRGTPVQPATDVEKSVIEQGIEQTTNADFSLQSTESMLSESDPTPGTPAIISVKDQIVKFMPDGTAKIDLILEIQDIDKAVEYDIRVAKNAGNL